MVWAWLVVVVLYIALDTLWFRSFDAASDALQQLPLRAATPAEIAAVAQASAAAEARLTPAHRAAALLLGLQVGQATQRIGLAMDQPALRAQRIAEAQQFIARSGADALLGVAPAPVLAPANWAEFGDLNGHVERDTTGLAARIEAAASPRHRHLYQAGALLGAHGVALAAQLPKVPPPPAAVARHLALAGVPDALWVPLARPDLSATPQARAEAHLAALKALDAALRAPTFGTP
jgi:hypothetical protein